MTQAAILTPRHEKAALEACRTPRERALFGLSLYAGLRAVEIAGLQWSDVDLQNLQLYLKVTKGDKRRSVPLKAQLAAILQELGPSEGYVFPNTHSAPGRPVSPNAVNKWFGWLYSERLQWKGFSSHSGRRTFITRAARKVSLAGGSLKDVQLLAGHSNLKTTSVYIESDGDAQRKLIEMI